MQTWRQNECEKKNRLGNNKEIRNQTNEKKYESAAANTQKKTTLPFFMYLSLLGSQIWNRETTRKE